MKQYIEARVDFGLNGIKTLKFDYSDADQKDWAKKELKKLRALRGSRNILSINLREE